MPMRPGVFCPGLSKSLSLSGDRMAAQGGQRGVTKPAWHWEPPLIFLPLAPLVICCTLVSGLSADGIGWGLLARSP